MIAIDAAGPAQDDRAAAAPAFADGPEGIVTMRNVLPDWAVRLLVGTLLLPAFLTALDGFFRVRRRQLAGRPWLVWLGASALPVLLAWLWVRALGLTGALEPPEAPVLPLPPLERGGAVALGSIALRARARLVRHPAAAARARRRAREPGRGRPRPPPRAPCCACSPRSCGPRTRTPPRCCCPPPTCGCSPSAPQTRLGALVGRGGDRGRAPAARASRRCYYVRALGLDPLELAWMTLLGAASGQLSIAVAAVAAALLACLAALIAVMRARRRVAANAEPEPLRTRGPATYAGPGSLGGTESALRR